MQHVCVRTCLKTFFIVSGFTSSKLFGRAPFSIIGILVKENITANFHLYCLTEKVKNV
jgi:hypothetical protein